MPSITIVTGNPGKLREYESLLPKGSKLSFAIHKLDLPEIQSLDSEAIVRDKLLRAFDILQSPVIVEDVSAGLDSMGGLPGPFFKFFEEKLGCSALLYLTKQPNETVTITCTIGYYDGTARLFSRGELHGKVVEPRGKNGFGFDPVVIPEGETRTMAEMTPEEKNTISHRSKAVSSLLKQLSS